jgi:nitroreductase
VKCRIEIIHTNTSKEPIKLGTYGFIKGASTYLALIVEEGRLSEEGAAYMFEQVVLYCTSLGLGTCWLGVSFNKNTFIKQLNLKSGEKLRIVSPVGYASEKRHLSLFVLFGSPKSYKRKPFTANFFHHQFDTPLTEENAGIYAQPLEMVRLAPSANNKQSWRVVLEGETLHFYKSSSYGFDAVDLGIALCHFEQSCHELYIAGHFKVLNNFPIVEKATYVMSWSIND